MGEPVKHTNTDTVETPNGSRRAHSDSPLVVSTDGSALGNPNGPMGWGWVDHRGGRHDAGGASNGTNQIGELCAVLQALRAHPGPQDLIIESDSQYAINCSTKWVHGWKKNGWKNAKKQSVKNAPLIKAIDAELSGRSGSVKFKWVKGHAGNEFNEKVDDLAHGYATHIGEGKESGYLPIEGWQSLLESPYATRADIPDDVKLILAGKAPHSASDAVSHSTGVADDLSAENTVGSGDDAPMQNGLSEQSTLPTSSDTETQTSPHSEATPSEPAPRDDHDDASLPHVNAPVTQSHPETEASGLGKHSAPNPEQTTVSSENRRKPRLHASGRIRLTPPPSSNGRYADASLHVSGTLHVDTRIDNDGYVDLEDAVFTMDWFSANGQQNA